MSHAPISTQRLARRAARRALVAAWLRTLGRALVLAGLVSLMIVAADKLVRWQLDWRWVLGSLTLGGVVGSAVWAWRHRPSELQAAQALDRALGLEDRLSSGLELAQQTDAPFAALAVQQAERAAQRASPKAGTSIRLDRSWLVWPVVMTAAVLVAMLVPMATLNSQPDQPTLGESQQLAAALDEVIESAIPTPQSIQLADETNPDEARPDELRAIEQIRDQLESGTTTPAQARVRAAEAVDSLADRLEHQAQIDQARTDQLRQTLAESAEQIRPTDARVDDLIEALGEGDFDAALDAADQLAEQLDTMSPDQRTRAAEALDELAARLAESAADTSPVDQPDAQAPSEPAPVLPSDSATDEPLPDEDDVARSLREQGMDPVDAQRVAEQMVQEQLRERAQREAARDARDLREALREAAGQLRNPPDERQPSPDNQPPADDQPPSTNQPTDASQSDTDKPNSDKPDQSKLDQSKLDQSKPDRSKPDQSTPDHDTQNPKPSDQSTQNQPSSDPRSEPSPSDQPRPDASSPDQSKPDQAQPDQSKPDQSKPDSPASEPTDQPDADQPRTGQPDQSDQTPSDQPSDTPTTQPVAKPTNQPTPDAPHTEKPHTEKPDTDSPSTQTPDTKPIQAPDQPSDSKRPSTPNRTDAPDQPDASDQPSEPAGPETTNHQPTSEPTGTPASRPGSPTTTPSQRKLQSLRERLDDLAQRRHQQQIDRQRARQLRQQRDELLEGLTPDQRDALNQSAPRQAPGPVPPPAESPADPDTIMDTPTDRMDLPMGADNDAIRQRVLAEWDAPPRPGQAPTANDTPADAPVRQAVRGAKQAIEQQRVPRRYRSLIQRVYDRLDKRTRRAPEPDQSP